MTGLPPVYCYLVQYHQWHETMQTSTFLRGLCPLHQEKTPSFDIHFDDGHFYCHGCGEHGDVVRMVYLLEGYTEWSDAYDRVRALDKTWITKQKQTFQPVQRPPAPAATEEQQETMTVAARYWYQQFQEYKPVRDYALGRGVSEQTFQTCWQVGYAPAFKTGKQTIAWFAYLKKHLGERWRARAIEVGLLTKEGGPRLKDRLVFSCLVPGCSDTIGFYQARVLCEEERPGESKFLNPWQLRKVPFWLPVQDPAIDGTVVSESPFGPWVLHQYQYPGMGTLGTGKQALALCLCHFASPFWLCQDNDKPVLRKGEWYQPGQDQAEQFAAICLAQGQDAERIEPAAEQKGLDEWVHAKGIVPLSTKIAAYAQKYVA